MSYTITASKSNEYLGLFCGEVSDLEFSLENLPLMDARTCRKNADMWRKMHSRHTNFYNFDQE